MFQWDVFLQVLGNRGVTNRCPVCEQETEWGHGDHLAGLTLLDENRNMKPTGGIAVAAEERWSAYLTDDEPPEVAFCCPECAEREFK